MARLDFPSLALGAAAAACALLFWERRKRQIKATFQAIVNPPDEPMSLLKAWLAALIFTWFILEPSEIMSGVCFSNMSQYRCCRPLVRCRAKCKELGLEKIDITSFF